MPGWNLKEGVIKADILSDDEYWSLFNFFFSDSCKKTNTYKFGLIKAICDQIYDLVESKDGYDMSYEKIFEKFAENYWNLVLKYGIKQMSYNGKSEYSKIETIIKSSVDKYKIPSGTPFESIKSEERQIIIKEILGECKKCVIGALYNDFDGMLYAFSLKGDGIIISTGAYSFIARYKMEIERINYYSWARFLEKINSEELTTKLLEKLDMATPQRTDLSAYREILYKEFHENTCFYCGRKIGESSHVDHFIPWSFLKTDNLWNFVLACPRCNIRKSNYLASEIFLQKIDNRNSLMIERMCDYPIVRDEFRNYYTGIIDKIWSYARRSGIKMK